MYESNRKCWFRLRFRLRTLLIGVTLFCSLLGFRQALIRETLRKREAIDAFEASSGSFKYGSEMTSFGTISMPRMSDVPDTMEQTWPIWLVGDQYLLNPEWAYYGVVFELSSMFFPPSRKGPFSNGTDDGMRSLQYLPSLRGIDTGISENITDVGMEYIAKLPRLEALLVQKAKISDAGLAALAKCRTLKLLDVSDTPITSAGISSVSRLSELRVLILEGTRIDDGAMHSIESLLNLRKLSISRTNITDRALQHITSLQNLEELEIEGTSIDDEGLGPLLSLRHLKVVRARASRVTVDGVRRCESCRPDIAIKGVVASR